MEKVRWQGLWRPQHYTTLIAPSVVFGWWHVLEARPAVLAPWGISCTPRMNGARSGLSRIEGGTVLLTH